MVAPAPAADAAEAAAPAPAPAADVSVDTGAALLDTTTPSQRFCEYGNALTRCKHTVVAPIYGCMKGDAYYACVGPGTQAELWCEWWWGGGRRR